MQENNAQPNNPENNEFRSTFTGFKDFLDEFCGAISSVMGSEGKREQAEVLSVLRKSLMTQAEALNEMYQEVFDAQDQEGRQFLEKYIKSTGVRDLILNGRILLKDASLQKRTLLEWIIVIIEIIKNILVMLGEFFPAIQKLLLIIGEVLEKIIKLLLMIFGDNAARIADLADETFWKSLERYWSATAALKRNQAVL